METGKTTVIPVGVSETAPISFLGEVFGVEAYIDASEHTDPDTTVKLEIFDSTGASLGSCLIPGSSKRIDHFTGLPATKAGILVEHVLLDASLGGKFYKNVAPWVNPTFKVVLSVSGKSFNAKVHEVKPLLRAAVLEEVHHSLAVVRKVKVIGSFVSTVTTAAFASSAGNLLTTDTAFYAPDGVFSAISDSTTNTWATARAVDTSAADTQISQYYAKNINGGAANTVTVDATAACFYSVFVLEISGADTTSPLDVGGNATSSAASSHPVSTSATTTIADTIAVGLIATDSALGVSSYVEDAAYITQSTDGLSTISTQGTRIVSAAGVQTRTVTSTEPLSCNMHIATYKAAAGVTAKATIITQAFGSLTDRSKFLVTEGFGAVAGVTAKATIITEAFGTLTDRSAFLVTEGFGAAAGLTAKATIITEAFGTFSDRSAFLVTEGFGNAGVVPPPRVRPSPDTHDGFQVYRQPDPHKKKLNREEARKSLLAAFAQAEAALLPVPERLEGSTVAQTVPVQDAVDDALSNLNAQETSTKGHAAKLKALRKQLMNAQEELALLMILAKMW